MAPLFTIIIPTHNHGALLRYSVAAVQAQTVQEWELFIIGDGVTPETRQVAQELAAADPRITFLDHPKHPRRGETYRHAVLTTRAQGTYVCYSCDDDLWLPDHLDYMQQLLKTADLAHPLACYIDAAEQVQVRPLDLQLPYYRKLMLEYENRIGLSSMAHTLAYYKRLPYGWRTTPVGQLTDLYMYRQFLAQPDLRVTSGRRATVLNFPDGLRKHYVPGQKLAELKRWSTKIQNPDFAPRLVADLMQAAYRKTLELESEAGLMLKLLAVIDERDRSHRHVAILQKDAKLLEAGYQHYKKDAQVLRHAMEHYKNEASVLRQALEQEQADHAQAVPAAKRARFFSRR